MPRPRVYLSVSLGGNVLGERMVFELATDVAPRTCENFRALCTGEAGVSKVSRVKLHYKGSTVHRIISGFMLQGGDFTRGDGTGGESIYGAKFADESFALKHTTPGLLSMANAGPNTNGSQFFVTFAAAPHLDGKHVVFGRLVGGEATLRLLERVSTTAADRPRLPVVIVDCGVVEREGGGSSLNHTSASSSAAPTTAAPLTSKELFSGVNTKALNTDLAGMGLPTSFGGRVARVKGPGGSGGIGGGAMGEREEAHIQREGASIEAGVAVALKEALKGPTLSSKDPRAVGGVGVGGGVTSSSNSATATATASASASGGPQEGEGEEGGESSQAPMNPTQARLFALKLRMNAGRKDNHKEVVLEYKRGVDPVGEAKERARLRRGEGERADGKGSGETWGEEGGVGGKRPREEEGGGGGAANAKDGGGGKSQPLPPHLHISAADAAANQSSLEAKQARMASSHGVLGGDEDAQFRSYERRVKGVGGGGASSAPPHHTSSLLTSVPLGSSLLRAGGAALGGGSGGMGAPPAPAPERLDRLVSELAAQEAKRSKFSRRRTVDEEVGGGAYINDKNREFLDKVGKATDKYTVEIKQALERGTR